MAQFARPNSDVATGAWTATPLNTKVDEVTRDDGDLITSSDNSSSDICELGLSSVSDPNSSTGHILRYTYRKDASAGHSVNFRARLLQGATEIASFSHTAISETFVQANQTLSAGQADAITDYADLRVEFERSGDTGGSPGGRRSAQTSWAELEVPDAAPGPTTLTPDPAPTPITAPSVTLAFGGITKTPDPAATPIVAPSVSVLLGNLTLTPDPVGSPIVAPSVVIILGVKTLTPDPAVIPLVAPNVTVDSGSTIITPDPAVIPIVAPAVTLELTNVLTPDSAAVVLVAPDVSVALGNKTLAPSPAGIVLAAPEVTILGFGGQFQDDNDFVPPFRWLQPWYDAEGNPDPDNDSWRKCGGP